MKIEQLPYRERICLLRNWSCEAEQLYNEEQVVPDVPREVYIDEYVSACVREFETGKRERSK